MKRQVLITLLLTSVVLFSFYTVSAQSISGDDVCGNSYSTVCTAANFKAIFSKTINWVVGIGSALLVVFIIWRFSVAWFALQQGNANAYKEALKLAGNAVLGFVLLIAIFGGLYLGIIKFISVQPWATQFIQLISDAFIPHAYAQGNVLSNPLGTSNLYDFILTIVRLVVRWFIFPAIVVMWVFSGFLLVAAQGNPEKLKTARNLLLYAAISTVIALMTEAFLFAIRGSVQQILS
jgi:hypothetical protein